MAETRSAEKAEEEMARRGVTVIEQSREEEPLQTDGEKDQDQQPSRGMEVEKPRPQLDGNEHDHIEKRG